MAKAISEYAAYLSRTRNMAAIIEEARATLANVKYDTIVCTGVSGMSVAPVLSYLFEKNLLVVRKSDDSSTHSMNYVEGTLGKRWLFVDDFVASGHTARFVNQQVSKFAAEHKYGTKRVGIYSYGGKYEKPGFLDTTIKEVYV